MENLCDSPTFTGYSVDGGYAGLRWLAKISCMSYPMGWMICRRLRCCARASSVFAACAYRRGKRRARRLAFGFGASAHLALPVLQAWELRCVPSRRAVNRTRSWRNQWARKWVGNETETPPVMLDRAVTFAPSGDVVVAALWSQRKGGVVAINAIHPGRIPEFDYDRLLWGERQIRSVANMTRQDPRDFLNLASEIHLQPRVTTFPLAQANEALLAIKHDAIDGAAVLVPGS